MYFVLLHFHSFFVGWLLRQAADPIFKALDSYSAHFPHFDFNPLKFRPPKWRWILCGQHPWELEAIVHPCRFMNDSARRHSVHITITADTHKADITAFIKKKSIVDAFPHNQLWIQAAENRVTRMFNNN